MSATKLNGVTNLLGHNTYFVKSRKIKDLGGELQLFVCFKEENY